MMKGNQKQLLSAVLSVLIMLGILTSTGLCGLNASAADKPPYCGVDVSKYNGDVNWSTVKARGVDFAVLRCYSLKKDEKFDQNYKGAVDNGIAVGAYIFMYAEDEAEARQEAQGTLNALGGKALDLPLFLDVEYKKVLALDKKTVTDLMLIELEMFRAAGYKVGIYTSLSFIDAHMDASRLKDYTWWVARWTREQPKTYTFQDESPYSLKKPTCDMWQFSDAGSGSYYGMGSTYVDLDFCYFDFSGGSGQSTTPDNPGQPTNPDNPGQPTNPDNPEQPTNPDNPEQPTNPDNPEQPTTPAEPEQPTTPAEPEQTEPSFLEICLNLIKWFWNLAVMVVSYITE